MEYKRATDRPIGETEELIDQLLSEDRVTQPYRNEAAFLRERLRSMRQQFPRAGNEGFMLRQLYISSMQRALQVAAPHTHSATPVHPRAPELPGAVHPSRTDSAGDEFTKLAIQRLLRELPPYLPKYEYSAAGGQIDCVLEPVQVDLPAIVIEAKSTVVGLEQYRRLLPHLRKYLRFWGKGTIGVILAPGFSERVAEYGSKQDDILLISFDVEQNELVGPGAHRLARELKRDLEAE